MTGMVNGLGKYGSFAIEAASSGTVIAKRTIGSGDEIAVPLTQCAQGASYEGWWGAPPAQAHTVITGVCLWGGNWVLEFEPQARGGKAARKSLALPYSRDEAYKRLAMGQRATRLYLPREPGAYHWRLVTWIGEKLRELDPARVLYHVPGPEYHGYHAELEQHLGKRVPEGHVALDRFLDRITEIIMDSMPSWLCNRIQFIDPMTVGARDSIESYLLPYVAPERFGVIGTEAMVGVEDLVEVRLAHEAALRTGRATPVLCGVVKEDHEPTSPYLDNTLRDLEYDVIDLR